MAIFEKRVGAPTGVITLVTGRNSYALGDGGTINVTDSDDIATLRNHPYVQLQGGTGGAIIPSPVLDDVFLQDGVLVRSSDRQPVSGGGIGAADWTPNSPFAANRLLRAPDLSLVRSKAAHTSGAAFDPSLYDYIAGKGVVGYAEITVAQAGFSAIADIAGLALPTFTINAGDPAIWIEARVPYWALSAVNTQGAVSLLRTEDSTIWGSAFTQRAAAVNDVGTPVIVRERLTAPGSYTMKARAQALNGGTVTVQSSARVRAYIIAQREV